MKYLVIVFILLLSSLTYAQKGTIRGTVYDDNTGETLVGVTVLLKGTYTGTITDLDGKFTLKVDPGSHDLQLSFISFQTLTLEGLTVKENEVTVLNNLSLKETSIQIKEAVVTASIVRNNEAAIQILKKRSTTMLDGISAVKMDLIGDGTAVEAAKRVVGVTVEEGKYVYVRGLGDRYSKTTLNTVDVPGLDPDKNTLQLDIIPTNLIDNMMISKNFTADLPADFTGGLMNIEIKDFPEREIFNVSLGTSFNPDMHFNSDYLTYDGGSTDFLGFDDGTRALPSGARQSNLPSPISGHSQEEVTDFIGSFDSQLGAKQQNSFTDFSFSLSLGNQIDLDKNNENASASPKLGYIFSASYKKDYKYFDNVQYGEFQNRLDPDVYEMNYATVQNGALGEENVLVGLLGGLAYKNKLNKYRLTIMHLQNGQSRAGIFDVDDNGASTGQSGYIGLSHVLEYHQRSFTNVLLNGKHVINETGWEVDWRISPTFSTLYDPDIRKTTFEINENKDPEFNAGSGGFPSRRWRELNELNTTGKMDVTKSYKFKDSDAKLKFGLAYTYKNRDYEMLSYTVKFYGPGRSFPEADPSLILDPGNFYPNMPYGIAYQTDFNVPNSNEYNSNVHNTGLYVSNELYLLTNLKTSLGLRMEYYVQRHTGRDINYANGDVANGNNLEDEVVLESLDLFPAVNLIWEVAKEQNLRASYSRTIARPSFKEMSYAQILDPISDRIYNGSLFEYPDWNGKLVETRINNLDMRWEHFFEGGQNISASVFYKTFDKPIELVRIPEQQTSTEYQTRNVGDGMLYGFEFEFNKSLNFLSSFLKSFSVNGNITLVESQIKMTETEFQSREIYKKTGETIEETRQMAGQAPYVINAGISYNNNDNGLNAGLFYNVKGPTLLVVGSGLFPDIYTDSFHSLNFSLNKKFGEEKNSTLEFKVSNILNDTKYSYYKSYPEVKETYDFINPGRTFSLGFSYKF